MTKKYLAEVHQTLEQNTTYTSSDLKVARLNIRVPVLRKLAKTRFSFSKDADLSLQAWDYIWRNSPYFEAMSMALYNYQKRTLTQTEFSIVSQWVDRCSCWEHSDDLSKIYAQTLEENPTWVIPTLKSWNHSDNSWKRRQSLVSLLEYSSKRKIVLPFNDLISYVTPLLKDEEYYVQKGLGWTLREIYNVYPKDTLDFLTSNLNLLSSIAYSSSTEKLDKQTKSEFNLQRKLFRQRSK
ncbi:MAG: DNA alkylation repair protein [Candidatus Cloacimonetes bacterium]|nr:DNA alkylation repair protein [Candidatus Cloacimonadota bacterium]